MGRHTQNERELKDGRVLIYQRTDVASLTWHCRIKFPDKPYIRQSLKTRNEQEATKAAFQLFDDLSFRLQRGLPLRSYTFEQAIDAYFEWLKGQVQNGKQKANKQKAQNNYVRYMKEYFNDHAIDRITDGDIEKFKLWRHTYWTSGPGANLPYLEYERNGKIVRSKRPSRAVPSASTWNNEVALMNAIFQRARKNGWITETQIPVIEREKSKTNRRAAFDDKEVKILIKTAEARYHEAKDARYKYLRGLLQCYVSFLAYSGMRPFEAIKLRWEDIDFNVKAGRKEIVTIKVSGKNKKRKLVVRDDFMSAYHHLVFVCQEFAEHKSKELKTLSGPIFLNATGKQIKSFKKGFSELMDAAGLEKVVDGKKREQYSLRHYYATQRLLSGVNVYTLAENMGTSVQMIERHYGHLKPELAAEELTKEPISAKSRTSAGSQIKSIDDLVDAAFASLGDLGSTGSQPPASSSRR